MARASERPIITLTTDFGQTDHYVACMKGIILSIAPTAAIVDVTHHVPPQDVMAAAFTLRHVWNAFPPATIHVVVVDPTVGTDRRILAARYEGGTVIAPDNGVISFVHRDRRIEALHVVEHHKLFPGAPSATFHGRDIMAPVAARLAGGMHLHEVGRATDRIATLAIPQPIVHRDRSTEGQVVYVDRYGNLITNLARDDVGEAGSVSGTREVYLEDRRIGALAPTYAAVPADEPLALIGSTDMLEIAVNGGNAAETLAAGVGTAVFVR